MVDLVDDVVVHVDYAEYRLVMIDLYIKSINWYMLYFLKIIVFICHPVYPRNRFYRS